MHCGGGAKNYGRIRLNLNLNVQHNFIVVHTYLAGVNQGCIDFGCSVTSVDFQRTNQRPAVELASVCRLMFCFVVVVFVFAT